MLFGGVLGFRGSCMSDSARVDSIETLKQFRISLCKFVDAVNRGLDEAEAEIQRAGIWLKTDQRQHWKSEVRKRQELHTRAKIELKKKQLEKTPLGGRYSCVDERKALARAKERYEEAERKLANSHRWIRRLEQEAFNYKGLIRGLSEVAEADFPNAIAQLDRMVAALEAYVAVAPPGDKESMARAGDAEEAKADEESPSSKDEERRPGTGDVV